MKKKLNLRVVVYLMSSLGVLISGLNVIVCAMKKSEMTISVVVFCSLIVLFGMSYEYYVKHKD